MDGKKNFMKFWKNMAFSWNPSQQTFVRLEDVLKMYSKHVLKTSSTRLQRNNFTTSKTSWRHLAKMSWGRLEDFLKASWKTKNCYAKGVLKTSWRHALKTSWRHVLKMSWRHVLKTYLEDVSKALCRQAKYLLGISVSNKSNCVSNKSIFHKSISDNSKVNLKCIN